MTPPVISHKCIHACIALHVKTARITKAVVLIDYVHEGLVGAVLEACK